MFINFVNYVYLNKVFLRNLILWDLKHGFLLGVTDNDSRNRVNELL